jgi:hypothetical protein
MIDGDTMRLWECINDMIDEVVAYMMMGAKVVWELS